MSVYSSNRAPLDPGRLSAALHHRDRPRTPSVQDALNNHGNWLAEEYDQEFRPADSLAR